MNTRARSARTRDNELANCAISKVDPRTELARLHHRRAMLPASEVTDTEWAILLELLVAHHEGRIVQTKSLVGAAGVPLTTMLRYLDVLESKYLIIRVPFAVDRRVKLVAITAHGRRTVEQVFESADAIRPLR